MTKPNPFKGFRSSPEVIRLAVMMHVRFPLSLRNVEDLLHERGVDICHETVRFWWQRFGPMFAAEIRNRWIDGILHLAGGAHLRTNWHRSKLDPSRVRTGRHSNWTRALIISMT
jgi:hypothetical protein